MKAIYWILGILLACVLGYYVFYIVLGFVKIIIGLAALLILTLGITIGRISKK